ncbi:MAG TPA: response regulator transcription factor [Bryobacteraceae bacterium]|nr:response regulator transcription factor [Bryobacteraceae bacterium]
MPNGNCKLLIVDDEPALRKALRTSLSATGFDVSEARNGDEALSMLPHTPVDVVLLDINMPGRSGIDVCRKIRASSMNVGIIMVTVRDSEEDKVQALEAGADDFITKPYLLREMIARLRAVLRRLRTQQSAADAVLRAGALELDPVRRLLLKNGAEIHLSPKEFDLLAYLFQHQGEPVTHERLLHAVWGTEFGGEFEYLRSYVKMLRKKIEDDPARPEYIRTEPWVGYRFRNPSEPESPTPEDE